MGRERRKHYSELCEEIYSKGMTPTDFTIQSSFSPHTRSDMMWSLNKLSFIDFLYYRVISNLWDKIKNIFHKNTYKYMWQKITRGWSDMSLWNLDYEIADFIYVRLKEFRKNTMGIPQSVIDMIAPSSFKTDEEKIDAGLELWDSILGEIEWSFWFHNYDHSDSCDDWAWVRYRNGLNLFTKYLGNLWI